MNTETVYQYQFNKVAILGSGVMGAQIAAHFANLDIPVLMLGMPGMQAPAIKGLGKLKPPPTATASVVDNIVLGDFEQDLALLADCDLIIEAIIEDIEAKKQLFSKIAPHLNSDVVIASNTSGLSINAIAQVLPTQFRANFFGVHFFNPPRFMALVELIPTQHSNTDSLAKLEGFITSYLGKEVVYAQDSAGFVGNRLGIFALLATLHHAQRLGIAPDEVDALTGEVIGKAKSASFRTMDVVGLDIVKNVVDNIAQNQSDDPWHDHIKLPEWILKLIAQGHLGSKSKKGVYEKRGSDIFVIEPETGNYRKQGKKIQQDLCKKLKKSNNLLTTLLELYQQDKSNRFVDFLWSVHRDTMHYCAHHTGDIAHSVGDVDRALKAGFGWKKGVFENWQAAGIKNISDAINADIAAGKTLSSQAMPDWTDGTIAFFADNQAFSPSKQGFVPSQIHPVYTRQITLDGCEILLEDDYIRLIKIEDGIAAVSLKTKLNSLSYEVLVGINQCLDYLEQNSYFSLIFYTPTQGVFCAGANLFEVLAAAKLGRLNKEANLLSKTKQKAFELAFPGLPKINYQGSLVNVVALGQKLVMRLKHGNIYTIAAVDGLALGGGCEVLLHCDHTVATLNSYIGLVEVGVGVLPSFGGCKEMLLRANQYQGDHFTLASQYFEQIAMAKVASSAKEALEMGYLKPDNTTVIAHQKELLFSAINQARQKMQSAYTPPQKVMIEPVGQSGKANLLSAVTNFRQGNFISDHDSLIVGFVAEIFSAQVDDGVKVSQDWLIALERKHFMLAVATSKSQDRIEHMLKKHKPLRN